MITSIVIPVCAVIVLAVTYGFVRPRAGCGANCGSCEKACTSEVEGHHVG